MKQNFVLIVSIVIGIFAAILSRAWIDSKNAEYKKEMNRLYAGAEKIEVLVAKRPLPSGTTLQTSDLGLFEVFATSVTDDNILHADYMKIIGRTLVHSLDMKDPVLWTYIDGGRDKEPGLSDDIQKEMRAVSIPVSGASGVSGMIRPSDCVDVLGSFALPSSESTAKDGEMEMVTRTVLQNVTILAVGTDTGRSSGNRRDSSGYGTVTLQVTPREAEVLVFAQQMKGRLFLTLRNKDDVYFEPDTPRIDFNQIEKTLKELNDKRQNKIRGVRPATRQAN